MRPRLTRSEHLKQDGALRTDMKIEDNDELPKSWDDLKHVFKSTIHPDKKDQWDLERETNLKENLKLLEQVSKEQGK